jgi:hypothetical protein
MVFKVSSLFIKSFKAPKRLNTNVFGNKVDGASLVDAWPSLADLTTRQYSDCQLSVSYADGLLPAYFESNDSHISEMYHWRRLKPPDFVFHDIFHRTKLLPKTFWNSIATSLQIKSSSCFSYPCCFLSSMDNAKALFINDQVSHSNNVSSDLNQICTISEQIQNEPNVSFSIIDLNSFFLEITKAERINEIFLECIVSNKPFMIHEYYDKSFLKEDNDNNKSSLLNMDNYNLNSLHMLCPVQGMCLFFNTCDAFSTPHGHYTDVSTGAYFMGSAPVTHVLLNKMEVNHNLLHTIFQFKPLSMLNNFLISKTGIDKPYYSFLEILIIFRDVIRKESMFDPNNVSIILCSSELEDTLNVKAFHLSQLKGLILTHITKLQDLNLYKKVNVYINNSLLDADLTPTGIIRHASLSISSLTHKDAKFTLQPSFLQVIQSVNGTDSGKTVFSYSEVTTLLSMYILSRKDHLFDYRNKELALDDRDQHLRLSDYWDFIEAI